MRKILVAAVLACAAFAAAPHAALAGQCSLPDTQPLWLDLTDNPFWKSIWGRKGVNALVADEITPPKLRELGVPTVRLDLYLPARVGTPSAPLDPDTVVARANKLFDYAVVNTGCATPWIAENELLLGDAPTPWSETNARYRANVLLYLRTLAAHGAHPILWIHNPPFTESQEAADWWRAVAQVSDIVSEEYFPAPLVYAQGPLLGSRTIRVQFRRRVSKLLALGIPSSKLGIMPGFQTTPGFGGREGLRPRTAWFEVVKLQALAAKQVARELKLGLVMTWGWQWWRPTEKDPDKAAAACVWLWATRGICNGPHAAGKKFDRSLADGQLRLRSGVQCRVAGGAISLSGVARLQLITGERDLALAALFGRAVAAQSAHVGARAVRAAERAVIAQRFNGSRSAYVDALVRARVGIAEARGILADELRRAKIEARLRARRASGADVRAFYDTYGEVLARAVRVKPAPLWLNGRSSGLALSSIAPPALFGVRSGRASTVRGLDGTYRVTAYGPAVPLASLPFSRVAAGIATALAAASRHDAYERWLEAREKEALQTAVCRRDELPPLGAGDLTAIVPFLELAP